VASCKSVTTCTAGWIFSNTFVPVSATKCPGVTLIGVITGIGVCRSPPSVPAGEVLGLIQGAASCTSLSTCATDVVEGVILGVVVLVSPSDCPGGQVKGATQGSFFLVL
jgi:hypothetical protein